MPEYSTLAVAALKALCKERSIKGYSKLTRQALIDKLQGHNASTPTAPSSTVSLTTQSKVLSPLSFETHADQNAMSDMLTSSIRPVVSTHADEPSTINEEYAQSTTTIATDLPETRNRTIGEESESIIAELRKRKRSTESNATNPPEPDATQKPRKKRKQKTDKAKNIEAPSLNPEYTPVDNETLDPNTRLAATSHPSSSSSSTSLNIPTQSHPHTATEDPPLKKPKSTKQKALDRSSSHTGTPLETETSDKASKKKKKKKTVTQQNDTPIPRVLDVPQTPTPNSAVVFKTPLHIAISPASTQIASPSLSRFAPLKPRLPPQPLSAPLSQSVTSASGKQRSQPPRPLLLPPSSKSFRPLIPKTKPVTPSPVPMTHQNHAKNMEPSLYHLEFPSIMPATSIIPRNISFPPSLKHRTTAAHMSIILMDLDDESRRACTLVCKAWRYGIYLSAQLILQQDFLGARLAVYLAPFQSQLTHLDLWPYLRLRQLERDFRKASYADSWAARCLPDPMRAICAELWGSNECEGQIAVALRFLMARTYLSIGIADQRVVPWTKSRIVDALPVPGTSEEIWQIAVEYPPEAMPTHVGIERYLVIAQTGEVIGHSPEDPAGTWSSAPSTFDSDAVSVRVDWAAHLAAYTNSKTFSLMDRVRWSNAEEYLYGISRHWLKRVEKEERVNDLRQMARALRTVAERYVLASVVGNSLSGKYQTAGEMARMLNGNLSSDGSSFAKKPIVNLYVPDTAYVESVHFTSLKGAPLHTALALIQTPLRGGVYVLRDTGSEVGVEEEGVLFAWREVIGCGEDGVVVGPV